ncbi:MAG: transposase [Alphaproteobacteria bacterium]|nr:transposase [Alphaproteobacteria bacterium]
MADMAIDDVATALAIPLRTAQDRARRGGWGFREEALPTGNRRRLYPIAQLPQPVREAVLDHLARTGPAPTALSPQPSAPSSPAVTAPAPTADWQRRAEEARLSLLAEVDRMALLGDSPRGAMLRLERMAREGGLPDHLARAVPVANQRGGQAGSRTLSLRSLYRWFNARKAGVLAPKATPKTDTLPPWAPVFLRYYRIPSKPSIAESLERMAREGALPAPMKYPSYGQVRRLLERMSVIERNRGRMGPRELRSLRAYTARDCSELLPGDVYTADGHTYDSEIGHPFHGRPFRPEVTAIADVATKRVVGSSVALAEAALGTLDALRRAAVIAGPSAIFYVDLGSGFNNHMLTDEGTGLLARIGTTRENSLPGNSQARGVIERLHQTLFVRSAKRLPTYMGAAMDREARNKVYKITRAAIKAGGSSPLLPSWSEFVAFLKEEIAHYNARPHSSLPKIIDPVTGKRRHQSPDEAWAAAEAAGKTPPRLSAAEAAALFRPHVLRTTRRSLVELFGNEYFLADLDHLHGEEVQVAYDPLDAERVWVSTRDGRPIGEAAWGGHKAAYFPVSHVDKAREQRADARAKRLAVHLDEVEAERRGPALIAAPTVVPTADEIAAAQTQYEIIEQRRAPALAPIDPTTGRPTFGDDAQLARWLLAHPDQITDADRALIRDALRARTTRMWLEAEGIDLDALATIAA